MTESNSELVFPQGVRLDTLESLAEIKREIKENKGVISFKSRSKILFMLDDISLSISTIKETVPIRPNK